MDNIDVPILTKNIFVVFNTDLQTTFLDKNITSKIYLVNIPITVPIATPNMPNLNAATKIIDVTRFITHSSIAPNCVSLNLFAFIDTVLYMQRKQYIASATISI